MKFRKTKKGFGPLRFGKPMQVINEGIEKPIPAIITSNLKDIIVSFNQNGQKVYGILDDPTKGLIWLEGGQRSGWFVKNI